MFCRKHPNSDGDETIFYFCFIGADNDILLDVGVFFLVVLGRGATGCEPE